MQLQANLNQQNAHRQPRSAQFKLPARALARAILPLRPYLSALTKFFKFSQKILASLENSRNLTTAN